MIIHGGVSWVLHGHCMGALWAKSVSQSARSLLCQIAFKCIKVQAKEERPSWAALFDAGSAWEVLRAAVLCRDTSNCSVPIYRPDILITTAQSADNILCMHNQLAGMQ